MVLGDNPQTPAMRRSDQDPWMRSSCSAARDRSLSVSGLPCSTLRRIDSMSASASLPSNHTAAMSGTRRSRAAATRWAPSITALVRRWTRIGGSSGRRSARARTWSSSSGCRRGVGPGLSSVRAMRMGFSPASCRRPGVSPPDVDTLAPSPASLSTRTGTVSITQQLRRRENPFATLLNSPARAVGQNPPRDLRCRGASRMDPLGGRGSAAPAVTVRVHLRLLRGHGRAGRPAASPRRRPVERVRLVVLPGALRLL